MAAAAAAVLLDVNAHVNCVGLTVFPTVGAQATTSVFTPVVTNDARTANNRHHNKNYDCDRVFVSTYSFASATGDFIIAYGQIFALKIIQRWETYLFRAKNGFKLVPACVISYINALDLTLNDHLAPGSAPVCFGFRRAPALLNFESLLFPT